MNNVHDDLNPSFCRELIILPGAGIWSLDTYFNLWPVYHLYVLFVKISYQAIFVVKYILQFSCKSWQGSKLGR